MVRSTKPSLLRRLGALVAAAAMLVVLPAGVSTASAASDDADMLTVTMTRTDALGDEVYVGDTLTYSFTNTNNTSSAFTAFPAESNLSGVLTTGTPNCRYENLAGGASYPCSTASHTITADVSRPAASPRVPCGRPPLTEGALRCCKTTSSPPAIPSP